MAVSITVPTPAAPGQPVAVQVGKMGRVFTNNAEAVEWANGFLRDHDVAMAVAIKRAAERPASRGKTLTIDFGAANNIVREV